MQATIMHDDSPIIIERTDVAKTAAAYDIVRKLSATICEPLETEDYVIQSMPDASPAKWHLAHTSWFFETFVLKQIDLNYKSLHPQYDFLFNSYYNSVGIRHCRPKRGLLSRPTVADTYAYRSYVDQAMHAFFDTVTDDVWETMAPIVVLGLHHEQQHQELMLTDLKHVFSENPLRPVYKLQPPSQRVTAPPLQWVEFAGGLRDIGFDGKEFAFDNEGPRHPEYIPPYALASRLVTNSEYQAFIADGGYQRPEFWLSDGWSTVQAQGWEAPMYWEKQGDTWWNMTLSGMRPIDEAEPVCHVSYYEADAYAQWAGARLATEFEWEAASEGLPIDGNFVESGLYRPTVAPENPTNALTQMFGDVWEWTKSPYSRYPGYTPPPGALGEYNGKFTCNQFVLRGGSCATSITHIRPTYRNFFPPDARWQFMGIRLARDLK